MMTLLDRAVPAVQPLKMSQIKTDASITTAAAAVL
jgi:hypothetical protein